ncbi:type II toxin-antitoxin system PrlF family antitoxin [Variovorax sp. J22R24]|uniref:AbrB/MazE/SpoVT family DNA-binding domain-containing protein n=1 Tax=Variovorax gracilis TaxID=3053502 RepID=UPI0025780907|nr:type II toxin-antitoxin system PrlF family antitoxin [Variovorax sp. J22R24]MDM0110361.1 type II toxin-antitoxin system PrlF family antitoxin [Variovorax sp. J22R24]
MADSTVTAKGQTTVPQQVRDALNVQPGAKLTWHVLIDGTIVVRAKTKSILDLAGAVKPKSAKHISIKQMSA